MGHFQLPYSDKLLFQVCIFLEILGDNAVKIVTVGKCYIYLTMLVGRFCQVFIIIIIVIIIIIKFKTGQNLYMPQTILSVHPY